MTGTETENTLQAEGRTRRRKALIVAGIALLALFGASFAANIQINAGTEVEFGQGIEQILACDGVEPAGDTDVHPDLAPGVIVTLTSSDPTVTSEVFSFLVSGIVVSDIDEDCIGKILTVGLYDQTGGLLDEVVFDLDATTAPLRAGAFNDDATDGCTPAGTPSFPDGGSFVAGSDCFPSTDGLDVAVSAQDVAYVALETSDAPV